tara:strand:- start:38 stop:346 length:309 start_codon:yes stop_codon:yes gene_type:complete
MAKIKYISHVKRRDINRRNAKGKRWVYPNGEPYSENHICVLYDMYKQGRITADKLFSEFPGRTMKAIQMKVYSIRGRDPKGHDQDPNQMQMFCEELPQKASK